MNCKPGDLAYIVASSFPENVGRVAEVEHRAASPYGPSWLVRCSGALLTAFCEADQSEIQSPVAIAPDADLRPISGVPVNDEVRDEVSA